MKTLRGFLIPLLVLLLVNCACTTNQLTTSLDLTVTAAEVAVPILSQFVGVDPILAQQLVAYVGAVGQATDASIAILSNKQLSDSQRAAQITATFAASIAESSLIRNVLKGAPANVQAAIGAVIQAVEVFMEQLGQLNASASSTPAFASSFVASGPTHLKVDTKKLAKIRARARAVVAKANAAK